MLVLEAFLSSAVVCSINSKRICKERSVIITWSFANYIFWLIYYLGPLHTMTNEILLNSAACFFFGKSLFPVSVNNKSVF